MLTASAVQHDEGTLWQAIVLTLSIRLITSSESNSGSRALLADPRPGAS